MVTVVVVVTGLGGWDAEGGWVEATAQGTVNRQCLLVVLRGVIGAPSQPEYESQSAFG
jgi:hypothetical protein